MHPPLNKKIPLIVTKRYAKPVTPASGCTCQGEKTLTPQPEQINQPFSSGCMVCGAELEYFENGREAVCAYCGKSVIANSSCTNGHFVCDDCHRASAVEIIRQVCLNSRETDAVTLMLAIRTHPAFSLHGPEHHSLVPAVILTALRNSGVEISDEQILTAIRRGETIVGGSCAFNGICGAAAGVGIAVSVLEGATPTSGKKRQFALKATCAALEKISARSGARCCQRECWLGLTEASHFLQNEFGVHLQTHAFRCEQFSRNKECIQEKCPLWPRSAAGLPARE